MNEDATVADPDAAPVEVAAAGPPPAGQVAIAAGAKYRHFIASEPPRTRASGRAVGRGPKQR